MVASVATPRNKNRVPMNGRYLAGRRRPSSSSCRRIEVTTSSSKFCQRERSRLVVILRVTTREPTTMMSMIPQVNARVALSLTEPCCQKTISSVLRRMLDPTYGMRLMSARRSNQASDEDTTDGESEHAGEQSLPTAARDEVERD